MQTVKPQCRPCNGMCHQGRKCPERQPVPLDAILRPFRKARAAPSDERPRS
jgi:hypothetical protein